MLKAVLVFALLLIVKVLGNPMYTRATFMEVVMEEPCVVQGGMCVLWDHCNPGDLVRVADLCPKQSRYGVVCCYRH